MYQVYNPLELFNKLNSLNEENDDVKKFFDKFSFNDILQQHIAKENSQYVFKKESNENPTKSKIIRELNKLNAQNLQKVISSIR